MEIDVIGLGAGDIEQLPLGVYRILTQIDKVIIARTMEHPVIDALRAEGVQFESYDAIYEKNTQFDEVYQDIVEDLLRRAKASSVIYVVPGHPMVAEKTVQLLLAQAEIKVNLLGGASFLDAMFQALKIDPVEGFQLVDATQFTRADLNYHQHIIFTQVYDRFVASHVKLTLLEDLPIGYKVLLVDAAGTSAEKVTQTSLEMLDRIEGVNNLTSLYIPPVETMLPHQFRTLKHVIEILRGPEGCEWDKGQTHTSLRKYLLEETYELIEAIEAEDDEAVIEELGDVLLQVMLHSQIGEDVGYFTIDDVIQKITEKMIHRHPHVFGGDTSKSWDELKQIEKNEDIDPSPFASINWTMPSIEVAAAVKSQASALGFDWDNVEDIWQKFQEEKKEFMEAVGSADALAMEDEFGDLLFVLINIAKFYNISPELAMQHANKKFVTRFNHMHEYLKDKGKVIETATADEMKKAWQYAKEEGS